MITTTTTTQNHDHSVLDHDVGRRFFNKFVVSEYAAENLHFYDKITEYTQHWETRTDEDNLAMAHAICAEFVVDGCEHQVVYFGGVCFGGGWCG